MRTLGVDLAAQPKGTAACEINWETGDVWVRNGADDADLIRAARDTLGSGGLVAIDAPFGWPVEFVQAISRHAAHERFGSAATPELRLRRTDRRVSGRLPLSVSSDRIAIVAFRAARLLDELGPLRRDGSDRVIEVYPAAALRRWGLERPGYKKDAGARGWISSAIEAALPALGIAAVRVSFGASDDALDALIAALVGRAKSLDLVDPIPADDVDVALVEGWIWLPTADALRRLG